MCEMAGSPAEGSSVVSSTAISARAASRKASIEGRRLPNAGLSERPAASMAVPWRRVWMPVMVNGNSRAFSAEAGPRPGRHCRNR